MTKGCWRDITSKMGISYRENKGIRTDDFDAFILYNRQKQSTFYMLINNREAQVF
jgi:hypothetical protein